MRAHTIVGVLSVLAVTGCSVIAPAAAEKPPSTVTVTGTLTIRGGESKSGKDGEVCVMDGGYRDIRRGAQVVISDARGATIALGALAAGKLHRPEGTRYPSRRCVFSFSVAAPAGHDFYGVAISHRGRMQYTAAQIASPLELKLGGG